MKKYVCSILCVFLLVTAQAQTDIEKSIAEAQGYLKQKNYKDAQIALQQAITQLYEFDIQIDFIVKGKKVGRMEKERRKKG